ncbi:hypothetical protein L7F22_031161 [Adiantum nelumboides]|nr:hypothetical protein [Adiantum nelumboides]
MWGWCRRLVLSWHLASKKSWLSYMALLSLVLVFVFSSFDGLPALVASPLASSSSAPLPLNQTFTDLLYAYRQWDAQAGCEGYRRDWQKESPINPSLQNLSIVSCSSIKQKHVAVRVKEWTWLPDNLQNLYSCECGLTCMWTTSEVLADNPDVLVFESVTPPRKVNWFLCVNTLLGEFLLFQSV